MRFKILPFLFVCMFALGCSSTPAKRSFGEIVDDSVITNKLKVRYMKDKLVKAAQINVDTRKGVVSLKGAVDSQDQIDRAIQLAEQQVGVLEVKSFLVMTGNTSVKQGMTSTGRVVEERDISPKKEPANPKANEDQAFPDDDDTRSNGGY